MSLPSQILNSRCTSIYRIDFSPIIQEHWALIIHRHKYSQTRNSRMVNRGKAMLRCNIRVNFLFAWMFIQLRECLDLLRQNSDRSANSAQISRVFYLEAYKTPTISDKFVLKFSWRERAEEGGPLRAAGASDAISKLSPNSVQARRTRRRFHRQAWQGSKL